MPHRQFVFALPKALRIFFRHDRRLFGHVSRLIYHIIQEFYHQAAGRPIRTGVVIAHQTFGDMLRWNPHFHAIVLEGGFDEQGTFVYIPLGHLQAMTELLRRRVVALLVDQKLLDRRFARNMLSWRHSGFSIDNSVRILDRGVQRSLAEEPSGENRSGATGARSDHPRLNRLLGAEPNCRSDCGGGSTQGKVRTPASAAVFTEPHRSPYARHSHRHAPASAVVIAASATRSPSCRSVTIPMLLAVLLRSFALDYSSYHLSFPSGCAEDRVGRGHERTTHQSCDESLRRLGLRCPMMRRHYDARRRFELTGQVTPIHSPALVELVGRVPGAPPEQPTGSQPTTPCRGLGAACPPVAPRMVPRCHGWRSPSIGHDTAPAAGRPRRHGSVRPGGIGTQPALTTSAP